MTEQLICAFIGGIIVFMLGLKCGSYIPALTGFRQMDQRGETDDVTINVSVTVRKRWVPSLLGMLYHMQYLGSVGSSRMIGFYADGDGDFRPKFEVNGEPIAEPRMTGWGPVARPIKATGDVSAKTADVWFDAG